MSRRSSKRNLGFNKSKLVVLKAEDGIQTGNHELTFASPHFPSYLFTQEGKEQLVKVFLPVPSLFPPCSLVYYENYSSPDSRLSDNLQFIHIGVDPNPEGRPGKLCYDLGRHHEEYEKVTSLEFSESLPSAMTVFQVTSHFPNCGAVKIFLDGRHIFWSDLDPSTTEEPGLKQLVQLKYVCPSVTTLHLISELPKYLGMTIPRRLARLFYLFLNIFPNLEDLYVKMGGEVGEIYDLLRDFCSTKGIGHRHNIKLDEDDGILTCQPKIIVKASQGVKTKSADHDQQSQSPDLKRVKVEPGEEQVAYHHPSHKRTISTATTECGESEDIDYTNASGCFDGDGGEDMKKPKLNGLQRQRDDLGLEDITSDEDEEDFA